MARRIQVPAEVQEEVFERTGHACAYCGDPANQIDHVLPVSKGGSNDDANLVACCRRCNATAKNLRFKDFQDKHAYITGMIAVEARMKAAEKAA